MQAVYPVGDYQTKLLSRQYRSGGWGVPVGVVERQSPTGRYAEEEFLPRGMTFAATAVVRPDANGGAVLELVDPLHPDPSYADPSATLARDVSAPFALRMASSPELATDWLSFFGVDVPTDEGLFFLEPYQAGKIPVVMVHGNSYRTRRRGWTWPTEQPGRRRGLPNDFDYGRFGITRGIRFSKRRVNFAAT